MAYRNLKGNDGSNTPGVDGMTFENLCGISEMELIAKVKGKILNYQPKAVRRVYIPKPNGKKRPLGIPTVIDRIVQQSVLQILEPICEAKFYDKSYGFRPNRNTKNAVAMCYKYAQRDGCPSVLSHPNRAEQRVRHVYRRLSLRKPSSTRPSLSGAAQQPQADSRLAADRCS